MNNEELRKEAHKMVDYMVDYLENVDQYPVKSLVAPKEIYNNIPADMPEHGTSMENIMEDFTSKVMPGITHWQSPNFFAYFQANSSPPSLLAEMLMSTLAIQGMKWDTSPASTELEERMMEWLKEKMGIPSDWSGVIQDTASTATLASILTAREQASDYEVNKSGLSGKPVYRVYCSEETHSSIEKGAKIAGIGKNNVVKIPVDDMLAMKPEVLSAQIAEDRKNGFVPLCIVSAIGTTGTLAIDPLEPISKIAKKEKIWLHVDAAYLGTAMLLPEYHDLMKGIEHADSFVFNPHKWMMVNFDCSVYFMKDPKALVKTFEILPEYLKTSTDGLVNNHCDWGVPLGRRFRSLKLYFVMRYYGLQGLQKIIRSHIDYTVWIESEIVNAPDFELTIPRTMNLVCFRYKPSGIDSQEELNELNAKIMDALNKSGKIYLTHTKINGNFSMRMSIGQTNVTLDHVKNAWSLIQEMAHKLQA